MPLPTPVARVHPLGPPAFSRPSSTAALNLAAAAPTPHFVCVQMKHVAAAIAEMFNTGHMKLLREACRLEKLLLAAIYLETVSRWGSVHMAFFWRGRVQTAAWTRSYPNVHLTWLAELCLRRGFCGNLEPCPQRPTRMPAG